MRTMKQDTILISPPDQTNIANKYIGILQNPVRSINT